MSDLEINSEIEDNKSESDIIKTHDCIIQIENTCDAHIEEAKANIKPVASLGFPSNYTHRKGTYYNEQTELFNKSSIYNNNIATTNTNKYNRTIKEQCIDFVVRLIMQDELGTGCQGMSIDEATKIWQDEVGVELLEPFTAYIEENAEIAFDGVFGLLINKKDLLEIKSCVNIILGKTLVQRRVKEVIDIMFESYEHWAEVRDNPNENSFNFNQTID